MAETLKGKISMGLGFTLLFLLWVIPVILILVGVDTHTFLTGLGFRMYGDG